jgi:hypothetical protein
MFQSGWHAAHLAAIAAWGGLVAAEIIIEFGGRFSERLQYATARLHYWSDVYVEIPLLFTVLLTGFVLLMGTQPDALLWTKVACGLGAVGANAACVVVVFRRNHVALAGENVVVMTRLSRWVFRTAFVGAPLAVVALWIGGFRAGWW